MDYTTIGRLAIAQIVRHPSYSSNPASPETLIGTTEPMLIPGVNYARYLSKATSIASGESDGAGSSPSGGGLEPAPTLFDVVTAEALGCFEIRTSRLGRVALDLKPKVAEKFSTYMLREGDVVVSLQPPFRSAVASAACAGALVPNTFAIIRFDAEGSETIDPRFLALWLSSTQARTVLQGKFDARSDDRRASGRLLAPEDLFDLQIPLPEREVQENIGELLTNGAMWETAHWKTEEVASELADLACASVAGDVDADLETVDGLDALELLGQRADESRQFMVERGLGGEHFMGAIDELIGRRTKAGPEAVSDDAVPVGSDSDGADDATGSEPVGDDDPAIWDGPALGDGYESETTGIEAMTSGGEPPSGSEEVHSDGEFEETYREPAPLGPLDWPLYQLERDGGETIEPIPSPAYVPDREGMATGLRSPPFEIGFGTFDHPLD